MPHMQNPAGQGGASRDHFGWRSHPSNIDFTRDMQLIAPCFGPLQWEGRDD
jgi:hypothetical protein